MSFTYSRLGKKYNRVDIEKLDKEYHKELKIMY